MPAMVLHVFVLPTDAVGWVVVIRTSGTFYCVGIAIRTISNVYIIRRNFGEWTIDNEPLKNGAY